ncbi:hypothetical protein N665_0174s0012 [Sinapis alba]|nr:hypothetical protein N665_0174s0012 [Sinapis alba]
MSCYRLPKNTTKKLTSAVAQFWKSSGGSTKNDPWLSTTHPRPTNNNQLNLYHDLKVESLINEWRPTNNNQLNLYHDLKVESLINSTTRTWNSHAIWKKIPTMIGPTVDLLKAFCWKVHCPLKMKHFLWQILSGCITVKKILCARGMQSDVYCAICGPIQPTIFPTQTLFTNMDHLFWRVSPQIEDHQFAWILWYIWKGQNNKVFSNIDINLRETLNLAERKSLLVVQNSMIVNTTLPIIPGRCCFTDESWKDKELFSSQGWYSTLTGFDGLMGARNTRASMSSLHSRNVSAYMCNRMYEEFTLVSRHFTTNCS